MPLTLSVVELRCTCGAVLPQDARFCHRCGKPQYAEDIARLEAESPVAPVQEPLLPSTVEADTAVVISFTNSRAVLISLLVAAGAMIGFLPIALVAAPLFPFFLCAVGFVAVRFYKGRSAEHLSTSAGARLGWMTGLWLFIVVVVMITLTAILVSSQEGWEQLRTTWAKVPQASQLLTLSQHDFLMQMLLTVPFSFSFLLSSLDLVGFLVRNSGADVVLREFALSSCNRREHCYSEGPV